MNKNFLNCLTSSISFLATVLVFGMPASALAIDHSCPNNANTIRWQKWTGTGWVNYAPVSYKVWLGHHRPTRQIRALEYHTWNTHCAVLRAVDGNGTPITETVDGRHFCFGNGADEIILIDTDAGASTLRIPRFRHPRAQGHCTNMSSQLTDYNELPFSDAYYYLLDGDDWFWGDLRGGRETVYAGNGHDRVADASPWYVSSSPIRAFGGPGDDILVSGYGPSDWLFGEGGVDYIVDFGGSDDWIHGGDHTDFIDVAGGFSNSGFLRSSCGGGTDYGPQGMHSCEHHLATETVRHWLYNGCMKVFAGPFGDGAYCYF